MVRRLSDATGVDLAVDDHLGDVLIGAAMANNPGGITLVASRQKSHIVANARLLSDRRFVDAGQRLIRALAAEPEMVRPVKVSPFISVDAASSSSETDVALATEAQADLPGVLIYTPHLLSTVQHYVREHAVRLRRYRHVLAGRHDGSRARLVDDLPELYIQSRFRRTRFASSTFLLVG